MAGDKKTLLKDPALDRWYLAIHETPRFYFRWTSRTVKTAIGLGVVIPCFLLYLGVEFQDKYDFRGARDKESMLKRPKE
ncbi:hypothetical protein G9A89_021988 [Geosiphon pyriformis]|nr:hypothetical protein G9A89_021988 [Geosiphon pyriformis]